MNKKVLFILCLTISTFILGSCEEPEDEVKYEDVTDDDWKKRFIINNDSIDIELQNVSITKTN